MSLVIGMFFNEINGIDIPNLSLITSKAYNVTDADLLKKLSQDKVEILVTNYRLNASLSGYPVVSLQQFLLSPTHETLLNLRILDCGGKSLRFNRFDYVGRLVEQHGPWEQHVSAAFQALLRHLPENGFCVDIGAHVGTHSLEMAKYMDVDAFEPIGYNRTLLSLNVDAIKTPHSVAIHPYAVTDHDRGICMDYDLRSPFRQHCNLGDFHIGRGNYYVPTVTLDSFYMHCERELRMIKMDAQGAEIYILNGGRQLIEKHRPYIICEFEEHQLRNHQKTLSELYQCFVDVDYQLYLLSSEYPSDYLAVPNTRKVAFESEFADYLQPIIEDNPISQPLSHGISHQVCFPSTQV